MPNYNVSVSSEDNMLLAKAASETGLTVEQYLRKVVSNMAGNLREKQA